MELKKKFFIFRFLFIAFALFLIAFLISALFLASYNEFRIVQIDKTGDFAVEDHYPLFMHPSTPSRKLKFRDRYVEFSSGNICQLLSQKFGYKGNEQKKIDYVLDITNPLKTLLLKSASDIPGFDKKQLGPDLKDIHIGQFKYDELRNNEKSGYTIYIFYTYTQIGGVLKRYKLKFSDDGILVECKIIRIGDKIGKVLYLE